MEHLLHRLYGVDAPDCGSGRLWIEIRRIGKLLSKSTDKERNSGLTVAFIQN